MAVDRTHVFLSHRQLSGGDQTLLLRDELAARGISAWYDQDREPTASGMRKGIEGAACVAVLLSKNYLASAAVQLELRTAVDLKKQIIFLHEADAMLGGAQVSEIICEGRAYLHDAHARIRDDREGRLYLREEDFAVLFPAGVPQIPAITLNRAANDVSIFATTVDVIAARIHRASGLDWAVASSAAPPYKLRAMPPAGGVHILMVSGAAGERQLHYLRAELTRRCPQLKVTIADREPLPLVDNATDDERVAAASAFALREDATKTTAASSIFVLLLLSRDAFDSAAVRGAAYAALHEGGPRLIMRHEPDAWRGGADNFGTYFTLVPEALKAVMDLEVSRPFQRRIMERELMLEELLERVGAFRVAEGGRLAPPPLPISFSEEAVSESLDAVVALLLETSVDAPRAVILGGLGGLGKTAIAAAAAKRVTKGAGFADLLWVTVGRGGRDTEMRGALTGLLEELGEGAGQKNSTLDQLAGSVRVALEKAGRDAVLIVVDDLAENCDGYTPHFHTFARAVPKNGPSRVLITTREGCGCARVVGAAAGAVRAHELKPLLLTKAAGLLRRSAGLVQLDGMDDVALQALADATGRSPLALQITASALRASVEQPNVDGRGDAARADACAAELLAQLRDVALPTALVGEYAPVYRAIFSVLRTTLAPCDVAKFSMFAIFKEDADVPIEVLGAAWRMAEKPRVEAVISTLEGAGLLKRGRRGCVQLHDLAWEYAKAIGGGEAAHSNAIDRWREFFTVGGVWWRRKEGVGEEASAYVDTQLLRHLREAGRGAEGTDLVWKLQWLIRGVRVQGGGGMIRELRKQLEWEKKMGMLRGDEVGAINLLHQMFVMGAAAWEGLEGPGNVAAQIIGRLRGLETGSGGKRVQTLLDDAMDWDGGRKAWLRPLRPNFEPPGGACDAVLVGHTQNVNCVCALSGDRLATASDDKTVRAWDLASGACLRVLEGHTDIVTSVCALGDGRLASSSKDKTVRVWDAASGDCLVLVGHTDSVTCVCAFGDGRLASASWDKTVRVWDITRGVCVQTLKGHTGNVLCVCLVSGDLLASASDDKTVRVWDAKSGNLFRTKGHSNGVTSVCLLNDGQLASCSRDNMVKVWVVASGVNTRMLRGHTSWMTSVCALSDNRLASASADKTVRVWDIASGECVRTLEGHLSWVTSVCALSGGRLASTSFDNTVRVWNSFSDLRMRTLEGHKRYVTSVCVLSDGRLATASEDKTVQVWNMLSGASLRVLKGHTGRVTCLCALSDGRLASASADNTVRVWNVDSGTCLVLAGRTGTTITRVCELNNGRLVSVSSRTGTVHVWDAVMGILLDTVQHFSSLASDIVASSRDSDISTSAHCGRTLSHFSPWGVAPVFLGAQVARVCPTLLPSGCRVAFAGLSNGHVHFFEVVESR